MSTTKEDVTTDIHAIRANMIEFIESHIGDITSDDPKLQDQIDVMSSEWEEAWTRFQAIAREEVLDAA